MPPAGGLSPGLLHLGRIGGTRSAIGFAVDLVFSCQSYYHHMGLLVWRTSIVQASHFHEWVGLCPFCSGGIVSSSRPWLSLDSECKVCCERKRTGLEQFSRTTSPQCIPQCGTDFNLISGPRTQRGMVASATVVVSGDVKYRKRSLRIYLTIANHEEIRSLGRKHT